MWVILGVLKIILKNILFKPDIYPPVPVQKSRGTYYYFVIFSFYPRTPPWSWRVLVVREKVLHYGEAFRAEGVMQARRQNHTKWFTHAVHPPIRTIKQFSRTFRETDNRSTRRLSNVGRGGKGRRSQGLDGGRLKNPLTGLAESTKI